MGDDSPWICTLPICQTGIEEEGRKACLPIKGMRDGSIDHCPCQPVNFVA